MDASADDGAIHAEYDVTTTEKCLAHGPTNHIIPTNSAWRDVDASQKANVISTL
jgi:hypothetical protein